MRDTPRAVNASISDKKSPVNRRRSPIKSWRATRTQSPSLNRCSNSSSRQVKSTDDKQDSRGSTSYSKMKTTKLSYQKNCISVKTDSNKESPCMKRLYPDRRDRIRPKEKFEAPKNESVLLRDILTELKQPLYKDLPSMGRVGSGICSNRSFKPQLEDIKSSYLLLNQKGQDEKAKANVNQSN